MATSHKPPRHKRNENFVVTPVEPYSVVFACLLIIVPVAILIGQFLVEIKGIEDSVHLIYAEVLVLATLPIGMFMLNDANAKARKGKKPIMSKDMSTFLHYLTLGIALLPVVFIAWVLLRIELAIDFGI